MRRRVFLLSAMAAVVCLPAVAGADWADDFEDYPLGEICGKGGWEEWQGSVDVCGSVTDEEANSGDKSLKIVGDPGGRNGLGDDTVHRFDEEGGVWTFSVMTFIPDNARGGASIIMLNTYPPGQNPDWSLVVEFDADSGDIIQWPNTPIGKIVQGRWVEFRAEIDLENDLQDWFYDDKEILSDLSWTEGVGCCGQLRIQALDLYGGEPNAQGTTGTYFDDASLTAGGGERGCVYTIRKNSKAKRGCPRDACPKRGDLFASGEKCSEIRDCKRKIKIKRLDCPEGERGFCKKVKGKVRECKN